MRITSEKMKDPTIVFIPHLEGELKVQEQNYEHYQRYFKQLQKAQEVLEKLESLPIVGLTNTEEMICFTLDSCKNAVLESNVLEVSYLSNNISHLLSSYLEWLLSNNNNNLSVYKLRQAIETNLLDYNELLTLGYLFSLTKPKNEAEISKFELVFSTLYKQTSSDQIENLLNYVLPFDDTHPFLETTQQILAKFAELTKEISKVTAFHQVILNNYLEKARRLKELLVEDFWHKEVILGVVNLDLEIQKRFQSLSIEKNTSLQVCKKLLNEKYYTIDELEDGSILNLEAAECLVENTEKILAQEYLSHKKELVDIARIFYLLNQAERAWKNFEKPNNNVKGISYQTIPKTSEEKLEPLLGKLKSITPTQLEEQLNARTEDLVLHLHKKGLTSNVELRYSSLSLGKWEMAVLLSQGNLVENTVYLQVYQLVRRAMALIAELQETTAFLSQQNKEPQYNYSIQILILLLEQTQKMMYELDCISQKAQQEDINLSINVVKIKHKLEQTLQRCWEQTSISLPGTALPAL